MHDKECVPEKDVAQRSISLWSPHSLQEKSFPRVTVTLSTLLQLMPISRLCEDSRYLSHISRYGLRHKETLMCIRFLQEKLNMVGFFKCSPNVTENYDDYD